MGQALVDLYGEAKQIGGMKATMRLAILTGIPSAKASSEADSAENVEKFKKAIAQIKSEN